MALSPWCYLPSNISFGYCEVLIWFRDSTITARQSSQESKVKSFSRRVCPITREAGKAEVLLCSVNKTATEPRSWSERQDPKPEEFKTGTGRDRRQDRGRSTFVQIFRRMTEESYEEIDHRFENVITEEFGLT